MLYGVFRAIADVALRWYYSDVVVQGKDRIPQRGPVIIAANHPNALVDALVVATSVRRRVLLTAKATLFEHRLLAPLLGTLGVVPLKRANDAPAGSYDGAPSVDRNAGAFHAVTEALRRARAVLVFPEGVSHDEPALAPLRTGAARMVLAARGAGVSEVLILPIGLIFEQKERPRSRILARIEDPIDVDAWCTRTASSDAVELTMEIARRLRRVTLNFASEERARRVIGLARTLAAIADLPLPLGRPPTLTIEAELAQRVDAATNALAHATPSVTQDADAFIARVEAFESRLAERHVSLADLRISPRIHHGAWFVIREAGLAALALPIALVGRVVHWIPLRLARSLAMRPLVHEASRDQPATRTIVLGLAFVLVWYGLVGLLVARRFGITVAVLCVAAVFLAAPIDFLLHDRLRRAWQRARTYLVLRADPLLHENALEEAQTLLGEARTLEAALLHSAAASS